MNATNNTTATHTPGPWRVDAWNYQDRGAKLVIQNEADAVCELMPLYRPGRTEPGPGPEENANAKLIATAPELLVALEKMLAYARCGYDPKVVLNEFGEKAQELIERARGL